MGIRPGTPFSLVNGIGFSLFILLLCPVLHAQQNDARQLDWVPRAELTEAQRENCPQACDGAYVNPARDETSDPGQSPIEAMADSGQINTANETATLEGNVEFTQGFRQLRADRVEIDRTRGSLELEGNILIREPGILLVGGSASIDAREDHIEVQGAQYVIHEQRIRGTADQIERSPFGGISINNATYTTCEPGDEAWALYAGELSIDEQKGRATARDVKLEVANIPVAYVPWFQFIIDDRRASGLLYPEIGYSTDEGFKYAQPYYVNLAPNQDLTLTPRYAARRGAGMEAEYRLLTAQSHSQVSGTFFPDDDINPNYPDNRWATSIEHRGVLGSVQTQIDMQAVSDEDFLDDWATTTLTQDDRDLFLKQYAQVSTQMGNWQLSAATRGYQNLIEEDERHYRELPRLGALGKYRFGDIALELDATFTRFDLTNNQTGQYTRYLPDTRFQRPEGNRLQLDWSAYWDNEQSWGYIRPGLGTAYRSYQLDTALLGHTDNSPSAFAAEASLDAGLFFERQTSLGNRDFIQTLEPRFYYLYRQADQQSDLPVFDTAYATESLDQLFRDSIFVGGDRMEDANRLSLGVQSRFYTLDTRREVLVLGLGQAFYLGEPDSSLIPYLDNTNPLPGHAIFINPLSGNTETGFESAPFTGPTPPSVSTMPITGLNLLSGDLYRHIREQDRNRSELIGEADWQISSRWSASASVFWDTRESRLDRSRLELDYRAEDSDNFLRLGYLSERNESYIEINSNTSFAHLVEQDISQAYVRGQWKLDEQWGLVFGVQSDLENDRNLDRLFGVSYESCCWNIILGLRDRLERSIHDGLVVTDPQRGKSVILSFEFFGLGGIGRSGAELVQSP
jgi:LPS-assembly protein